MILGERIYSCQTNTTWVLMMVAQQFQVKFAQPHLFATLILYARKFTLFHNLIHQMLVFACYFTCSTYDIQISPFWICVIGKLHLIVCPGLGSLIFFGVEFWFDFLSIVWSCSTLLFGIFNSLLILFSTEIGTFGDSSGLFCAIPQKTLICLSVGY